MERHYATLMEAVCDAVPDEVALVHGATRRTFAEFDDRTARLAESFRRAGLGVESKVALYMYNSPSYVEGFLAALKARCVPVNVNYRYLDEELRYLLDNADAEALVFHSDFAERVRSIRPLLPKLKVLVEVGDDPGRPPSDPSFVTYDQVMTSVDPMLRIDRYASDLMMIYTGGTTGMPKGVMWDAGVVSGDHVVMGYPIQGLRTAREDLDDVGEIVREGRDRGISPVALPASPLMHGTGYSFGMLMPLLAGGTTVTLTSRKFDPHEFLAAVEQERVTTATIVGDAFSRPIVRAIEEGRPDGESYDLSSLQIVFSSGVMFTAETKQRLLEAVPDVVIMDTIGSSEGYLGMSEVRKGHEVPTGVFKAGPNTTLLDESFRPLPPGSERPGLLATSGFMFARGYYKDPEGTARTFRRIGDKVYSIPGDWGRIDSAGNIILLGRGSECINTGGEKVYPEEVEEAVKRMPGVWDCLVVGTPDSRFGERVSAVVKVAPGSEVSEEDVTVAVKEQLAGYKAPRGVVFVEEVPRAPNGKPDYARARKIAVEAAAPTERS